VNILVDTPVWSLALRRKKDIGGGFPAHYDDTVPAFEKVAKTINAELDRLFPRSVEILAEPGRFLVASAASAVAKIIGRAVRGGKLCYYLDDGVYHTCSGVIFDHCRRSKGATQGSRGSSRARSVSSGCRSQAGRRSETSGSPVAGVKACSRPPRRRKILPSRPRGRIQARRRGWAPSHLGNVG
jgi:hypothetical protein